MTQSLVCHQHYLITGAVLKTFMIKDIREIAALPTDVFADDMESIIDRKIKGRHRKIGDDIFDNAKGWYLQDIKNGIPTGVLSEPDIERCKNLRDIFDILCTRGQINIGEYKCLYDIIRNARLPILNKFVKNGEDDIATLNESKKNNFDPTSSHDRRKKVELSTDVQADAEPYDSHTSIETTVNGGYSNQSHGDEKLLPYSSGKSAIKQQTNTVHCQKNASKEIRSEIEMKFPHYDIILLHAEEDYTRAKEIKEHWETHEKIVNNVPGKELNVLLYSDLLSIFNVHIKCMEIGLKHSTYVFILVTEALEKDEKIDFLANACLVESLDDETKRWCIVPVLTHNAVPVPFCLKSLCNIRYARQDESYFERIVKLINLRRHLRQQREEKQIEDILELKRQTESMGGTGKTQDYSVDEDDASSDQGLNELRSGGLS